MTSEISSNQGYLALKVEATEGTAVTPTQYVPLYNETLTTQFNFNTENSVYGNKFARLQVNPGVRSHSGDIEVLAEPNTSARFFDMLLTKGSVTGSDPYTFPYTASFTKPKSYTVDISMGNQVARFMGVQASEIAPTWVENVCHWKIKVSALKSFLGAEIASLASDTITLKTPTHRPAPTTGLVAGDIVYVVAGSTGARQSLTILSLTSTTVTFTTTPSAISSGDMLLLRPATPSLALLTPFMWSRTEFRFADTAANALTATHTPLEEGSEFVISHPFKDDAGEKSSGSFDPSRLVRDKSTDASFKSKIFFENPDQAKTFLALTSQACVIRMFSGASYEFRLTLNSLTITKGGDKAMIKVDEALFYELEYTPSYNASDGQAMDVKVLNALSA